jgi:hypothetical protein
MPIVGALFSEPWRFALHEAISDLAADEKPGDPPANYTGGKDHHHLLNREQVAGFIRGVTKPCLRFPR